MKEVVLNELPGDAEVGSVVCWYFEVGDTVEKGNELCEISCGGISLQFRSPYSGIIGDIYCEPGDEIEAGESILAIDDTADIVMGDDDEDEDAEEDENGETEEDIEAIYDEL